MILSSSHLRLSKLIKQETKALGFQLVGITTPDPPEHINIYKDWVSSGNHAQMEYLSTQRAIKRRGDLLKIMPDCKSVLVVGINYHPEENPNKKNNQGKVATYALGEDYHGVIEWKLAHLIHYIELQVGKSFPSRIYTDTGPLLERDLAQRAGLGWIGKNTCLINPKLGSYFLLGEALLGIELEPDQPLETDHCGSCTRCIDNCPTGCILPNRMIDSNKCISYLTIEERGNIPRELREYIGDWFFGCDICQDVCPWNQRFSIPTTVKEFQTREILKGPKLSTFLSLTEAAYESDLKNSPLKRAKLPGLIRNAAVTAGNSGDLNYIPALARLLLNHPNPMVRSHCAWALGQLKYKENEKVLRKAMKSEDDSETRGEITFALDSLNNL